MLDFRDKKKPDQWDHSGEKGQVPGGGKGAEKTINSKGHEKKSARGRCLVSCSGTLFLLNDNVVDKLFGF